MPVYPPPKHASARTYCCLPTNQVREALTFSALDQQFVGDLDLENIPVEEGRYHYVTPSARGWSAVAVLDLLVHKVCRPAHTRERDQPLWYATL
jgi:hypothetical protein